MSEGSRPSRESGQQMDPLSEVLALLKPQSYSSGGFAVHGEMAIHFPKHQGIKCYAVLAGQCWLVVDGVPEPVLLNAGDCFVLPRGLPFRLATDLSLEPVHYTVAIARLGMSGEAPGVTEGARYIAGGHFALTGGHAEMLSSHCRPLSTSVASRTKPLSAGRSNACARNSGIRSPAAR